MGGAAVIPARLGHRTGKVESNFERNPEPGVEWRSTVKTEFQMFPLVIGRPADGSEPFRTTCRACGNEIVFRVASVREVKHKRILHLAMAGGSAAFLAIYLTVIKDATASWARFGTLGTIMSILLTAVLILAGMGVVVGLARGLSSEFRRAVIAPNMGHWLGRNNPDSIRRSFHEKRTGPTELGSHQVFPPTGKLDDNTSL